MPEFLIEVNYDETHDETVVITADNGDAAITEALESTGAGPDATAFVRATLPL